MQQELRDYQRRALDRVLAAFKRGARRVLLVLPTGGGKTTVFCTLIASLIAGSTNARAAVLVHRRELATQATKRLGEFGVDHGLILAGEPSKPYARVQVAGVQTLVRRKAPRAGLVVADEAHLSTAQTWEQILEQYEAARILGVTATPWRLGGKPLAGTYDEVIIAATPRELIAAGWLCNYTGFSYRAPDLSGVGKVGDDYNRKQAGAAMSALVPNVVEKWLAHASDLSTIVFATTVEHSKALTAEFIAAGVRAEHLDGSMRKEQRRAIIARVEAGVTQVLCNVGVAVEGLDIPRLKCCVLARPTMSLARALQMMGRVLRPWLNPKTNQWETARIHDHAFVITQHGLPDDDRDYSLDAKQEAPPSLALCESCLARYLGDQCPACGGQNEKRIVERTGPEIIEDAEQVDFSSATPRAPAPPPTPIRSSRQVNVEWNTVRLNKAIAGHFVERVEEMSKYGKRAVWLIEKRGPTMTTRYALPGTYQLNQRMAVVRPGEPVRVTYLGERFVGEKTVKNFAVAVERSDADDAAALDFEVTDAA